MLFFLIWVFVSFCAISACNLSSTPVVPKSEITVSAAASLQDALEALKPLYSQEHPEVTLIYNFGSSGSLQQQIEQGAPIDVFLSAAPKQMNALQDKGLLLNETRQDFLKNQIVLIVSNNNTTIKRFQDLGQDSIKKVALGEPESVPAGKYAQEVLTSLGLVDTVKPKTVYAKDVRQVLSYVETGNTDAGIVYQTDAQVSDQVKIVEVAPENTHSPVIYPVAVVKNSKNVEGSKEFVEFLFTPKAQELFEGFGFKMAINP